MRFIFTLFDIISLSIRIVGIIECRLVERWSLNNLQCSGSWFACISSFLTAVSCKGEMCYSFRLNLDFASTFRFQWNRRGTFTAKQQTPVHRVNRVERIQFSVHLALHTNWWMHTENTSSRRPPNHFLIELYRFDYTVRAPCVQYIGELDVYGIADRRLECASGCVDSETSSRQINGHRIEKTLLDQQFSISHSCSDG